MQDLGAAGDGTVTPDELRSGLQDRLAEFDADDSGTLSIDEFEALHSATIREAMVDRFQALDNDGDGEVTAEEMTAPAARMQDSAYPHAGAGAGPVRGSRTSIDNAHNRPGRGRWFAETGWHDGR